MTHFLKKLFYEVGANPGCLFLCLSSMDSRIKHTKTWTPYISRMRTNLQHRLYMHKLKDNAKPLTLVTNVN